MAFSLQQELNNFSTIELSSIMPNEQDIPDNIKSAIKLYNKAYENLLAGSEDIAIIELKKAINLYPDFCEAMNLLGICYVYTGDYSKASELFEKVVISQKSGVKAAKYLTEIGGNTSSLITPSNNKTVKSLEKGKGKNKKATENKKEEPKENRKIIIPPNAIDSPEKMRLREIMRYFMAFAAGVLVVLIFVGTFANVSGTKNNPEPGGETSDPNVKLTQLNEEYARLQNDYNRIKNELNSYKNSEVLKEIENLVAERKYEEAADRLINLKTVDFRDNEKARVNDLYNNVVPKASFEVYKAGKEMYYVKDFQNAKNKFQKLISYGGQPDYLDDALFTLGMCYYELNDKKNALAMFEKVKANYPEKNSAFDAQKMIERINQQDIRNNNNGGVGE